VIAPESHGRSLSGYALVACFFAVSFLLAYVLIDPKLIYHGHGQYLQYRIHVSGMSHSEAILSTPGQVLEYLAANLAHLYHSSWAGALIIAVTAWLLSAVTGALTAFTGSRSLRLLRFLPGILLLVQYGRYHPYLGDALSLLLGLLLARLYAHLSSRGAVLRLLVFSGLASIVYVAGTPGFPVFVALCAISDSAIPGRGSLVPLLLVVALPIPWVAGVWGFGLEPLQAYGQALPTHPEAAGGDHLITSGLFLCVPIIALGAAFRQHRAGAISSTDLSPNSPRPVTGASDHSSLRWWLEALVLVGVTTGAVLVTADTGTRSLLRVNYFARHHMWSELLEESRRVPPNRYSIYVNCDVNRALYHTQRLSSELFSYPQHGSRSLLLMDDGAAPPVEMTRRSIRQAEVRYEMGLINQAEHFAHEALEQAGYCPAAMQRLALVNLVKGQPEAASVFLRALSGDFLYREWAQHYLRLSADGRRLAVDPEIRRQRALMLKKNTFGQATPLTLFEENKQNHMAFEYLMAFSLLEGQHFPVVHNLEYLDTFDYPEGSIPRHYEEAILLHARITGTIADLHGRRIRPETVSRFQDFLERSQTLGPDPAAVLEALYEDFGNTYYYYYLWLRSQGNP